jgi:DNA-directed RNA polymerase specialized sigma24 family protein
VIVRALAELPKREARLIILVFWDGLPPPRIARKRHVSTRAIYAALNRIYGKLAVYLGSLREEYS